MNGLNSTLHDSQSDNNDGDSSVSPKLIPVKDINLNDENSFPTLGGKPNVIHTKTSTSSKWGVGVKIFLNLLLNLVF